MGPGGSRRHPLLRFLDGDMGAVFTGTAWVRRQWSQMCPHNSPICRSTNLNSLPLPGPIPYLPLNCLGVDCSRLYLSVEKSRVEGYVFALFEGYSICPSDRYGYVEVLSCGECQPNEILRTEVNKIRIDEACDRFSV